MYILKRSIRLVYEVSMYAGFLIFIHYLAQFARIVF